MKYVDPFIAGTGSQNITLEVAKNTAIVNTLFATGSIFAIKLSVVNGVHSDGQPNNVINLSLTEDYVVWNIGWNGSNGTVSTDSVSIAPGDEVDTPTTGPMNFDWRSDLLSIGPHTFEQSNGFFDDKRHAVLLFGPLAPGVNTSHTTDSDLYLPYRIYTTNSLLQALDVTAAHSTDSLLAINSEFSHSTDSLLSALRVLGHSSNTSLFAVFDDLSHSSNSFLFSNIILGNGAFFVGADINADGIVGGSFVGIVDPSCLNRRILGKYGWEPTSTPTKTFTKCNPKR